MEVNVFLIVTVTLAALALYTISRGAIVVPQQNAYVSERLGKYSSIFSGGGLLPGALTFCCSDVGGGPGFFRSLAADCRGKVERACGRLVLALAGVCHGRFDDHRYWVPLGGGSRARADCGCWPGAKVSMTIMVPPQLGQGWAEVLSSPRSSSRSWISASSGAIGALRCFLASARFAARFPLAKKPVCRMRCPPNICPTLSNEVPTYCETSCFRPDISPRLTIEVQQHPI